VAEKGKAMAEKPPSAEWFEVHSEELRRHGVDRDAISEIGTPQMPSGRSMVRDAKADVDHHISRQPHVQRLFSFMPTLMTRVSPFHLASRSSLKSWPLVRLASGRSANWGRMGVVGEMLVIFDETVLFALLLLMRLYRSDAFETSTAELCRLANIKESPRNASDVWQSVRRLAGTRIDLELTTGKGKRRQVRRAMSGAILGYADRTPDADRLRVVVNPYFYEMYADSFVANIDIRFRASLKRDVSKAFYRYLQGQTVADLTVALVNLTRAVNIDVRQPPGQLLQTVRSGLSELQRRGYLQSFSVDSEMVHVQKAFAADFRPEGLPISS
jgi:hypothetical protein